MIFVIGTDLTEEQLPSFTEYELFSNDDAVGAKMKLRIAQGVTAVYINEQLRSVYSQSTGVIPKPVRDMFTYFNNDEELLTLISGGDTPKEPVKESKKSSSKVKKEEAVSLMDATDGKDTADDTVVSTPLVPHVPNVPQAPIVPHIPRVSHAPIVPPVAAVQPTEAPMQVQEDGVSDDTDDVAVTYSGTTEVKSSGVDGIEDIDDEDDFTLSAFKIPGTAGGNYDSVASKLEAREKQLEQYKSMMAEKGKEFEDTLQEMDAANAEMISAYEKKLSEASQAFSKVKSDLAYALSTTGKYHLYAERFRSILKEGFEPTVKEEIKALNLDLIVMCTADNVTDMQYLVQQNIDQFKENCVFIDMTDASYFNMVYGVKLGGVFDLFTELTDAQKEEFMVKVLHRGNADLTAEYNFHDIAFLDCDWLQFFKNLKELFPDRKIVLLFNSISSFSVMYTVSELATIFRSYLHLRCSPVAIKNAYMRLKFIPKERGIKIVATYLFDDVKDAIKQLGQKYVVVTSPDVLSITEIDKR